MDWQQNITQLKRDWDRDGYLIIRGFMSPEEAQEVASNIDRYVANVLPGLPQDEAFYEDKSRPETIKRLNNMSVHDEYFRELYQDDRFVKLAEALLNDGVIAKNMQWFNKNPHDGKETPPHQDGFYFMLEPNEALTFWLALDHVDEENGCIRYVKGSHLRGMRPHQRSNVLGFSLGITDYEDADEVAETVVRAEPGDVALHHCMIVHRADANNSARSRRALGLVYHAERAKANKQRQDAYRKELFNKWESEGKI